MSFEGSKPEVWRAMIEGADMQAWFRRICISILHPDLEVDHHITYILSEYRRHISIVSPGSVSTPLLAMARPSVTAIPHFLRTRSYLGSTLNLEPRQICRCFSTPSSSIPSQTPSSSTAPPKPTTASSSTQTSRRKSSPFPPPRDLPIVKVQLPTTHVSGGTLWNYIRAREGEARLF